MARPFGVTGIRSARGAAPRSDGVVRATVTAGFCPTGRASGISVEVIEMSPAFAASCRRRRFRGEDMDELGFTDGVLDEPVSKVFTLWSRANVGEVFPDPITPLNATAGFLELLDRGWRDALVETRCWGHDIYDPDVRHITIACFRGYLFLNMSLFRLFGVRLGVGAEMIDAQYFGEMPGIPSYASEARPFDVDLEATAAANVWLTEEVIGAKDLSRYDAQRAQVEAIVAARPDLSTLSDADLLQRIVGWDDLFRVLWCSHIVASTCAGLGLGGCAGVAAAVGKPELSLVLSGGIGNVDSAGASFDMWPLSRLVRSSAHLTALLSAGHDDVYERLLADTHADAVAFTAAFERFLQRWGFRGPNEWELRSDTWGTRPAIALAAIAAMRLADDGSSPEAGEARPRRRARGGVGHHPRAWWPGTPRRPAASRPTSTSPTCSAAAASAPA